MRSGLQDEHNDVRDVYHKRTTNQLLLSTRAVIRGLQVFDHELTCR